MNVIIDYDALFPTGRVVHIPPSSCTCPLKKNMKQKQQNKGRKSRRIRAAVKKKSKYLNTLKKA